MAVGDVNAGYRGIAVIDGTNVRFTDANITVRQEINAPDLIMGDWDRDAYNFAPAEIGGTISGPVTENFALGASSIFQWATNRTIVNPDCGILDARDVTLHYFCSGDGSPEDNNKRIFKDMLVNSINFSCAAGDVANFSLDIVGATAPSPAFADEIPPRVTTEEKLVTWDKVFVDITAGHTGGGLTNFNFSNFDFTIGNNIETVYAIQNSSASPDLFPFDIVPGLRTISGSLSVYNVPGENGADTFDDYAASDLAQITFNVGGPSFTFKVQFHRVEPASSVGPIISTVGFTGVGSQTTLDV